MKKLISLCLSAVMILSLITISFTSVAAETVAEGETTSELTPSDEVVIAEDGSWKIEDNTLYIYGSGPMEADESWKEYFFSKAVIEEGITTISNAAFKECAYLNEITIPSTVTYIGYYAFLRCQSLTEIVIPETVTFIDIYAFSYCTALKSVVINAKIDKLAMGLFYNCTALNNVVLPESLVTIESAAFYNTNLASIALPDSISEIGEYTFYQNSNLAELKLPSSLTKINASTFRNCNNINDVKLTDAIEYIGDYAFYGCENISNICISDSVSYIGECAFACCKNLDYISVDESNAFYDSRENCNALIETATNTLLRGTINTEIPNTISTLAKESFSYCYQLENIIIPDSVSQIDSFAFSYCPNLLSIVIPKSVSVMDEGIFNQKNSSLVIYGYSDSEAQSYARENHIEFVSMDGISSTEPPEASDDELQAPTEESTESSTQAPTEEKGPFKVEGVQISDITDKTYTVQWEPLEEAVKYWVYVDGVIFVSTTDTSVTIKGKTGTEYCVQVVAKLNDDRITKLTRATTVIAQVLTDDTINVSGVKAVTLGWDEIEGISKYWVYSYNEATDSYSAIASTKTNSVSLAKLDHTNNYQLKVRTFIDGVLTDIDSIKVTYDSVCTSKVIDADNESLTITWTPFESAEKYWVFVSSTTNDIKNTDEWTVYSTAENNLKTYMAMESATTYNIVVRVKYTLEDGTSKTFDYKTISGTTK